MELRILPIASRGVAVCANKKCPVCGNVFTFNQMVSLLGRMMQQKRRVVQINNLLCASCGSELKTPANNPWAVIAKYDAAILAATVLSGFICLHGGLGTIALLALMAIANVAIFFVSIYIYYCLFSVDIPGTITSQRKKGQL
jgi:hypothetical protein